MTQPLRQYPLGTMIPDTVHAVCCSLPTLEDVIGYEEKRPETLAKVTCGYPRFVLHRLVEQAMTRAAERLGETGRAVYLLPSRAAAEDCVRWAGLGGEARPVEDFFAAILPESGEARRRATAFLQHTGLGISSRQAEDYLVSIGCLAQEQPEDAGVEGGEDAVRAMLRRYVATDSLQLANSGMNAFYGALRAVRDIQAPRGRRRYLQLGWLYLDTQRILEQFLGESDALSVQHDVFDEEALRAIFARWGNELAAIVTELPTNPLIQTPNVALLRELCEAHGVMRIFDPTIAGVSSVDVLAHTDVLVTSLTKYAAHEGDVMIGAVAINPASPHAAELAEALPGKAQAPYGRDLARLAAQIGKMPEVTVRQSENARRLADWLESHPGVRRVWRPRAGRSGSNYAVIARSDTADGAVFTIELNGPLERFYDRARVVKGPSFGAVFTMMCPFMYLAHYDDVSEEAGRARLKALGLNPELVRISAGCEPFEEIQTALAEGLAE